MRIDKYLKLTCLIKRRTVAKALLDKGVILLNGKVAKPSSQIEIGDVIFLPLGRNHITIKVIKILEYVKKKDAITLYEVIESKIVEYHET